jgi:Na+-transporting methylmalonyl-CoA/oxaloacetate decarboxylase gamma subunit
LLLVLGVGLVVLAPFIIIAAIIGGIIYVIRESYDSNRYICLKCEYIFKS